MLPCRLVPLAAAPSRTYCPSPCKWVLPGPSVQRAFSVSAVLCPRRNYPSPPCICYLIRSVPPMTSGRIARRHSNCDNVYRQRRRNSTSHAVCLRLRRRNSAPLRKHEKRMKDKDWIIHSRINLPDTTRLLLMRVPPHICS